LIDSQSVKGADTLGLLLVVTVRFASVSPR
jgi:hypothetical protein